MVAVSRSGSSIILVAVTPDGGQHVVSFGKGFNPGTAYRYTFEQFLGEITWREEVLHAITADFSFTENTRFNRMLRDRGIVPDARNPLGIDVSHIYRVVTLPDFRDVMALRKAVVEREGLTIPSADTIVTNISGTAQRIIPASEIEGEAAAGAA